MNIGDKTRGVIDRGRSGDKVSFPDPAAAPLGTDAEAGGISTWQPRPAMARMTPPLHGPAISDERGRRIDGELTRAGRSRVAMMTVVGLVLVALLGAGLALVGLAAR